MAKEWVVPDCIVEAMREPLRSYAELVKFIVVDRARALTLFGAITTSGFDAARQTARSVLVMDRIDLALLRALAAHGAKLGKAGIAAPLVMTPEYIKSSLDTFPLELIDIHQHHVTVFGEEYFDDLSFEDSHVRLQCERELKVLLIGLRQGLLAAAGREKFIGALEMDVGQGLMRTLRGLLWLKGHKKALQTSEVLREIERVTERKLPGIRTALDTSGRHGWEEFETLYCDVEALGEIANAW